jgi:predicted ATP-grasp superfamily ATP-dependent carboligase
MVLQHEEVRLRDPVMIAAFRGWNDAGEAATFAAMHLARVWGGKKVASIDPEEFYDFQVARPHVELVDGVSRTITWPTNEFWAARLEGAQRDALVLVGTEPNGKWRTFTRLIVEFATEHNVQMVVTLGALLADVAHSRPVNITGTAGDKALIEQLGLERSRYEGPTGIVGVLHDALGGAQISSASLWAAVPHYLAITPNPRVALALVRQTSDLIGVPADVDPLEAAASAYDARVSEMVEADEDVQAYVRLLEERTDERAREELLDPSQLPTGDSLAAELEHFLRERGDPS